MRVGVVRLVGGLLLSLAHVAPAAAEPCDEDPCEGVAAVRDVELASAVAVPTDGVLVLAVDVIGGLDPARIHERIALTVTLDGEPVAGALVDVDVDGLLIWRPAAPLQPEATYEVAGSVTNPPDGDDICGAGEQPLAFEFTTTAGPAAPLDVPRLTLKPTYFDEPVLSLTTAVCCDDAMPHDQVLCGESLGITWAKGKCAATSSRGWLRVLSTGSTAADPASSGQWVRVLLQDGAPVASSVGTSFQRELEAPACLAIVQRSLATGEATMSEAQCVGDDRAAELGVREVDPTAMLEACNTDRYTCEIRSGRWDPLQCATWYPDGEPPEDPPADETGEPPGERGCNCTGAPGRAHAWAIGLLVLASTRRRRPRRLRPSGVSCRDEPCSRAPVRRRPPRRMW